MHLCHLKNVELTKHHPKDKVPVVLFEENVKKKRGRTPCRTYRARCVSDSDGNCKILEYCLKVPRNGETSDAISEYQHGYVVT